MKRSRAALTQLVLAIPVILLLAIPANALVNPTLQPMHLCERYHHVVKFTVTAVDDDKSIATLAQVAASKGEFAAKTVTLAASDPDLEDAFFDLILEGDTLVAFIGKERRGRLLHEVLFYTRDGRWQIAMIDDPDRPHAWRWTQDLGEDYFGTFNGRASRLFDATQEYAEDRYYFPAIPFTRFRSDTVVGTLSGPARGVALHDIDGDGDLDIYATSPAGNRLFLQTDPMQFEDRTAAMGLDGIAGTSVNVADVSGDGKSDLLVDDTILIATGHGFKKTDLLPAVPKGDLRMSLFAEINGDGCPDVVLSIREGGLKLFLNDGSGSAMKEVTKDMGLDTEACGAGRTGYACAGDWNHDGRTDLFYAAAGGLILVQNEKGEFRHEGYPLGYEFASADGVEGASGGGCFSPLWTPDAYNIITTRDTEALLLVNDGKYAREMNGYGNEITEGTRAMLAILAEDLNADGLVDVYATTRMQSPNIFFSNRGHGSFMADHKYDGTIFTGKAHLEGAWGAAAGDVDGDGAIDLCLTGNDGTVTLMISDALKDRTSKEHMRHHEKMRAQIGFATVTLGGNRGVLGAEVTLVNDDARLVAQRTIGANVLTGCRSPDAATFAVMHPGVHTVRVRFSDGTMKEEKVEIATGNHVRRCIVNDR